jgi:hypothetical protein
MIELKDYSQFVLQNAAFCTWGSGSTVKRLGIAGSGSVYNDEYGSEALAGTSVYIMF